MRFTCVVFHRTTARRHDLTESPATCSATPQTRPSSRRSLLGHGTWCFCKKVKPTCPLLSCESSFALLGSSTAHLWNKDTFQEDVEMCMNFVAWERTYASWALECLLARALCPRQTRDGQCTCCTVCLRMNNECAESPDTALDLMLKVRSLMVFVDVIAGDLNGAPAP